MEPVIGVTMVLCAAALIFGFISDLRYGRKAAEGSSAAVAIPPLPADVTASWAPAPGPIPAPPAPAPMGQPAPWETAPPPTGVPSPH